MPKSAATLALAAVLAVGHCWTVGTGYRADMGMQLVNGKISDDTAAIATTLVHGPRRRVASLASAWSPRTRQRELPAPAIFPRGRSQRQNDFILIARDETKVLLIAANVATM